MPEEDGEPGTSGDDQFQGGPSKINEGISDPEQELMELSSCDDGELSPGKMKVLESEILGAVKNYTKNMALTKDDYYGNIVKKVRNKQR
jgi:hypothetical protein